MPPRSLSRWPRRGARASKESYGSIGEHVLRHRPAEDLGSARLAPAGLGRDPRQSAALRGLLPPRDAPHDHLPASPAHQHPGAVRRHHQRGRRRPDGAGGRGAPRHCPRAARIRPGPAPGAQARRPPHARSADEGAQEVRPARRPVEVPVLEAVEGRRMLRVAVAGASGYMGAELLRLLSVHPKVQIAAVTSERLSGERLDSVFPHLRSLSDVRFQELDPARLAEAADVVFLALPHMESQRAVPVLRQHGRKVIDLSADYRLRDGSLYSTWYKAAHIDPEGLKHAVYG